MKLVVRAVIGASVVAASAAVPFVANAAADEGTVTGHVVGTGLDLAGYSVILRNDDGGSGHAIEDDGSFTIEGVEAGTYEVGLSYYDDEEGTSFSTLGDEVTVVAGGTVTHDVGYGVIHGIVSGDGQRLDEGEVRAFRGDSELTGSDRYENVAYLPSDGTYRLVVAVDSDQPTYVYAQPYTDELAPRFHQDAVTEADATTIPITTGADITVDFDLPRTSKITGKLTGLSAKATYLDREAVLIDAETKEQVGAGRLNKAGSFRLGGLEAGRYLLSFARASGAATTIGSFAQGVPETSPQDARVIEIGPEATTVVLPPVAAKRGAVITGKIVTRTGKSGKGRANLRVVAVPTKRTTSTRSTWTRKDGTFSITGLANGSYKVYVWNADYPFPNLRACKEKRVGSATVTKTSTIKVGTTVFATPKGKCLP